MSSNKSILFGVRLPCAGVLASPGAMLRVAQEAEELGYDSVWVHDYLIWNKTLDQFTCRAARARRWRRLETTTPRSSSSR